MRKRSREVLVKCPVGIANYLMNMKREHIAQIELRYGMAIRIEGDPRLVSPDFSIEKFKTATRTVPEVLAHVVSVDTSLMDQVDEDQLDEEDDDSSEENEDQSRDDNASESSDDDGKPKKRRRRRRRSRSKSGGGDNGDQGDSAESDERDGGSRRDENARERSNETADEVAATADAATGEQADPETDETATERPKKVTRSRSSRTKKPTSDDAVSAEAAEDSPGSPKPKPKSTRSRSRKKVEEPFAELLDESAAPADMAAEASAPPETDVPDLPEPEMAEGAFGEDPVPVDAALDAEALPEPEAVQEPDTLSQDADPVEEQTFDGLPDSAVQPVHETPAQVAVDAADIEPEPAAPESDAPEGEPEPAEESGRELASADADDDGAEDSKPKKRGWWSIGR